MDFLRNQWISTRDPTYSSFAWSNPYQAQFDTNALQPSGAQPSNLRAFGSNFGGNELVGLGDFAWPYAQANSQEAVYPVWDSYSQNL